MTVAELIKALSDMPRDEPVFLSVDGVRHEADQVWHQYRPDLCVLIEAL
jgi:hypothetical protein